MAGQPFRIDYDREGPLLRAHVTGVNGTLETTLAYWTALAGEVRRDPVPSSLLVVDDMEGDPPPPEQLAQFVQAMVGMGFEGIRVAYVEAHAHQIPEVEHAEILARERGFDVRVFGDEQAARIWLAYGATCPVASRRRRGRTRHTGCADARRVLRDSSAADQRRLTAIAGACIDARDADRHRQNLPASPGILRRPAGGPAAAPPVKRARLIRAPAPAPQLS